MLPSQYRTVSASAGSLSTDSSPSFFPAAKGFVVNGGEYYNVGRGGNVVITRTYKQDCREPMEGIVENIHVLTSTDVSMERQIYKLPGYRLYFAQAFGRVVAVMLYEGRCARKRCLKAAKFNQEVMHPNVIQMIGVSPRKFGPSFLVFGGDFEGSIESVIALALKTNLEQSLILGVQTVIGLSVRTIFKFPWVENYFFSVIRFRLLRTLDYSFKSARLDQFCVLSRKGNIVISFDPEAVHEEDGVNKPSNISNFLVGRELDIFHGLCQRVFDAARKAHYDHRQVRHTYLDDFEVDPNKLFDNRFEELDDVAGQMSGGAESGLLPTNTSPQKPPTRKQRRELVWNSSFAPKVSLEDVSNQFQEFLNAHLASPEFSLSRRRGRYTARTAHRCPGYSRIEITLSTDITRSTIVSHFTPNPHEICPVCNGVVSNAEIFNCICDLVKERKYLIMLH